MRTAIRSICVAVLRRTSLTQLGSRCESKDDLAVGWEQGGSGHSFGIESIENS